MAVSNVIKSNRQAVRQEIEQTIAQHPRLSDRAVARQCGVDSKTVADVRRKGAIPDKPVRAYLYAAHNAELGIVKVGMTNRRPMLRVRALGSYYVNRGQWVLYHSREVLPSDQQLERTLLEALTAVAPVVTGFGSVEMFACHPDVAAEAIDRVAG